MLPPPTSSGGSSTTSSSSGCSCGGVSSATDPYIIDMIKLADERICQMQTELDTIKQTNEILDTKVSNYKNQVSGFVIYFILLFGKKKHKLKFHFSSN
jgi:hypothetical protein